MNLDMTLLDFDRFVDNVARKHDAHMSNYSTDEQVTRAYESLVKFHAHTPLAAEPGVHMVDLAGFGAAQVHFRSDEDEYLLLSEAAESLGMPPWDAYEWARREHVEALEDQRDLDEQRGDGRIGWECLRGVIDLRFDLTLANPVAKPDAGGGRWSHAGDWLVAKDRVYSLLLDSPWSREFMDNFRQLMRHAFMDVFKPEGPTAEHFRPDVSQDEAVRRARRGPAVDPEGGA